MASSTRFFLSLAALALGGCGNTLYAISANGAASRVEEAKELSAEKFAPYEYYSAKAYLEKAQSEAAEADYGDATELADTAEEFADRAVKISKQAQAGDRP